MFRTIFLGCLATLFLVACDTAEERAEGHYQSALSLMEQGDVPRALVELRNVFNLNGYHRDARALYARTVLAEGEAVEAAQQYLRLVEQYPDDVEGRQTLAKLGIRFGNWDMTETQAEHLGRIAPDDPETQAVQVVLDYRTAILGDDNDQRRDIANRAQTLTETLTDSAILRTIVIDSLLLDGEDQAALDALDAAHEVAPDNLRLYQMRLAALARLGDQASIETTLRNMVSEFPDNTDIASTLIRFYASIGDLDGAEEFLRGRIVAGQPDDDARTVVIQFLRAAQDREAAMAQAQAFIDEGTNDSYFKTVLATLQFDAGQRQQGIAVLEEVLRDSEPGEQTNRISVALARMLQLMDNTVGARALIEGVLEQDPSMAEALLMRAGWLIDDDQADQAIVDLRAALDQEPTNAAVLSAMADAHLRNGDRDLAGEMLSLAVENAGGAPRYANRYARYLIEEGRPLPAEAVLIDALRLAPADLGLLSNLAEAYVELEQWQRADLVITSLRSIGTPEAEAIADQAQYLSLKAQGELEASLEFLATLSDSSDRSLGADYEIARTHLENDDVDAALAYVESRLAEAPDDPDMRFLLASVNRAAGKFETAETLYRALIDDGLATPRTWIERTRMLAATQGPVAAQDSLSAALQAFPDDAELLWLQAFMYEGAGDTDAAIGIYEQLYATNSNAVAIANNLASLLSNSREDAESLERAYRIARRLRESEIPAFQDTYGWISYRRGDFDEALRHLEPAAEGMPADPLVQYHLAMTYLALDMQAKALAQFEKSLEAAGDDPRPAFETARQKIQELR